MSYVYIKSEPQLFTVGFYAPDGTWHPESDHASRDTASSRVHYLNGGEDDSVRCPHGAPGVCMLCLSEALAR